MKILLSLTLILTISFLLMNCSYTTNKNILSSPDGHISIELIIPENDSSCLMYRVIINNEEIIKPSLLGISLHDKTQNFTSGLSLENISDTSIDETYTMPTGKKSICVNKANEKKLTFKNKFNKKINIIFRAYNDGIAFRYELFNEKQDTVQEEISQIKINPRSLIWAQKQNTYYEAPYDKQQVDTMKRPCYNLPALIETPSRQWMLISDAAVFGNYAACQFTHKGNGTLQFVLPAQPSTETPEKESSSIIAERNLKTPWRAMIMGSSLKPIVESVMIQNLNPPSEIKDLSWIKPGVAAFPWWSDFFANDSKEKMFKFIDMAAELGWQWVEFDIGLIGADGFHNSANWQNCAYIPEVVNYAKAKGVSIYGWDERKATDTKEERVEIFKQYKKWFIKGIKLDYLNSDKQQCMHYMEEAARQAAENELLVSFHGCIAPRGIQRTFPNIMTFEGVAGEEYYKINLGFRPNAIHNTTLPFTRNVVGPMDYTPCSFTIDDNRKTTRAHELALPFIYESGWMCMCDAPEAYLTSPAKPLLKKIQPAWDDIYFIDGYPGEYCCIARRKGEDWFVAGINSTQQHQVEISFDFLADSRYDATIYFNGITPISDINIEKIILTKSSKHKFTLQPNSGFVIDLIK